MRRHHITDRQSRFTSQRRFEKMRCYASFIQNMLPKIIRRHEVFFAPTKLAVFRVDMKNHAFCRLEPSIAQRTKELILFPVWFSHQPLSNDKSKIRRCASIPPSAITCEINLSPVRLSARFPFTQSNPHQQHQPGTCIDHTCDINAMSPSATKSQPLKTQLRNVTPPTTLQI